MNEVWKDIKGYEGFYQVSSMGRIRSLPRIVKTIRGYEFYVPGKIRTARLSENGYYRITLHKHSERKRKFVHRLVAETFLFKSNALLEVNHKNGIKTDNSLDNLEWVTRSENVIHAFNNGLFIPNRKLDKNQIKEIKQSTDSTLVELASKYNVSKSTIWNVKKGLYYKSMNHE